MMRARCGIVAVGDQRKRHIVPAEVQAHRRQVAAAERFVQRVVPQTIGHRHPVRRDRLSGVNRTQTDRTRGFSVRK